MKKGDTTPVAQHLEDDPDAGTEFAIDPICGMKVDPAKSDHQFEHQGRLFYFCCAGCKQTFEKQVGKSG
jgi:P-type Cu+ transporter